MAKMQTVQTNFTGGEFSPELEGRSDVDKYNSSAKLLQNVVVLRTGGITHRPPTQYRSPIKDETQEGRLIKFAASSSSASAHQLEFSHLLMRVRTTDGGLVESSPGFPFEMVTPFTAAELADLDWAQKGDTMIIVSPNHYPQRLRRFSSTQWAIDTAPLNPGAVFEIGERPAANLTISSAAVGAGRTVTASAAAFLASDVGRTLTWGIGVATITAFGSSTSITVTVTTAFPSTAVNSPNWTIGESPMTTLTPSAATPVGASITLTLGADGWRSDDSVGYIEVNGGYVKVTSYVSPTVMNGTILRELSGTSAAAADTWVLQLPLWNAVDGYPRTCTFHQGRLWFGNTNRFPQSVWGSRSGLSFDFTPGTDDDSAVYKTADSDESSPLQFISSAKSLLMLGSTVEFTGRGGVEKPITQTNMQIDPESEWGASHVRPANAGSSLLYVEAGQRALRSLQPSEIEGFDSVDLSIYSEHLLRNGVKEISYERRPNSVLWVVTHSGELHAFTYNPAQNTVAWASGLIDGVVESVSTAPTGLADRTLLIVQRTINGVTRRYVEYLNWDAGRGKFDSFVQGVGPIGTFYVPHLDGKTVSVTADGCYLGLFEVVAGFITLPPGLTIELITVGLPIECKVIVRAPEVGTGSGTSQGQAQSTNKVWVRLLDSVGLTVNGSTVEFRQFDTDVLDNEPAAFTGLKDVAEYGWADGESDLELVQNQGMPWTILAVIRNFTVNAS